MSEANSLQRFTDLANDFSKNSHEILPSHLSKYQHVITLLLVILSFVSVSSAFFNKNTSSAKYFASAIVASLSIGLTSVYTCNFFGVYI